MKCCGKCGSDDYNESNAGGYVNLGTAVNGLCEDLLAEKLQQGDLWQHEREWQHYYGLNGTPDLLNVTANFLQERLAQGEKLSAENLRTVNGVSGGLEALAWIISDPGDVVIVPTPTYARFFADMNERMQTKVVGMPLENGFELTAQLLEAAIVRQKNEGGNVKGFLYCNPNNPLGVVYPRQLTLDLMEVCKEHKVHFISDEIYALSVFDSSATFSSVLSLPVEKIPDPSRTHVLWGLSKDFGLAGFRLGFIYTHSSSLVTCLDGMCLYTCVPAHIQQVTARMLEDKDWLDKVYFPTNLQRLREAFLTVKQRLEGMNVKVLAAQAGLFCWADFSQFLISKDTKGEMELFDRMFQKSKLYLVPGSMFGCERPGWFRIIFAVTPDRLREGMNRLENMLMQMGPKENPKESQKESQKRNTKEQNIEDLLFDGVEPLVREMKRM